MNVKNLPPNKKWFFVDRKILNELKGEMTISQLREKLGFSRGTIANHLRVLEAQFVVGRRKSGNVKVYFKVR
ncbi:MAG: winged helix-turn-helix domain-containing protein [Candidatus Heimdallarchaeaceae archaeon]